MKIKIKYSEETHGVEYLFLDEESEEDKEKYGVKTILLQSFITCFLKNMITSALPYLGTEGTEIAVLCANNIFSIGNVEKALNNGYEGIKQVVNVTEEIGTKMFKNIKEGVKELANTIENGTKFLCGVLKMFSEKITEKITSLGAPEQTCNEIKEITDGFDRAIVALGFDNREQRKAKSTPVAKREKGSILLDALSDLNDKLPTLGNEKTF